MSQTLSVSAVAALHQISVKTIHHAIKTGQLKAEKLPGATAPYLLRAKDVDSWLAKRAELNMPERPGSSGYFAALARLDELPDLIAQHHSITMDLSLADTVIGCICSPGVERDAKSWALHLRDVMSGVTETSGAIAS
jgi:hypothetical protein